PNLYFFPTYAQPIVFLCGTGSPEGYLRYNPLGTAITWPGNGNDFSVNTTIDLSNPVNSGYSRTGTGSLTAIQRVEVLLSMADAGGVLIPSFDAGITTLGFSPP